MLEQKIDELIAAIREHIAAFTGSKSAASTTTTTTKTEKAATKGKTEKAAPTSKHNRDEVMALAQQVAGEKTGAVAKAIIQDVGGAAKLADVADSKLDALFTAFTNALAPEAGEEEEEEEL